MGHRKGVGGRAGGRGRLAWSDWHAPRELELKLAPSTVPKMLASVTLEKRICPFGPLSGQPNPDLSHFSPQNMGWERRRDVILIMGKVEVLEQMRPGQGKKPGEEALRGRCRLLKKVPRV